MITTEFDTFISELRSDARMTACADEIADGFAKFDIEADGSVHVLVLLEALLWIAQQPRRSSSAWRTARCLASRVGSTST